MRKVVCLFSFAIIAMAFLCSFFKSNVPSAFNEFTKEEFLRLYNESYLGSQIDSITWNGSIDKCSPGYLSDEVLFKAEKRINFFRQVNGLPKITLKKEYNVLAQWAALNTVANNKLNHKPNGAGKCYSPEALQGCENSNLGFNYFSVLPQYSFINGFIFDHGAANQSCGHRRWLLYSKAKEMGYGASNKTEAVYVNGIDIHAKITNRFIAYPWNGYVPVNLIFPKWSFSIPEHNKVDFENCKIIITDENGKKMHFRLLPQERNFLDHTLTWEMPDLFSEEEEEKMQNNLVKKGYVGKTITVTVSNVLVNHEMKNYNYQVKIIAP